MGLSDPNDNLRVITNSTFKRWLACRRQFYYRYIGRFRKQSSNLAAQAGTLIHALLEEEAKHNARIQKAGLREQEGAWRKENPLRYANKRLTVLGGVLKAWRENALLPFFEQQENASPGYSQEDVEESLSTSIEVFKNWLLYRGYHDLMRYDVVSTEFKFELPLEDSEYRKTRGWIVSGLVDCLLWDREKKIYILREYKTTSGDPMDFQSRVTLDPQVRIYADACVRSGLTRDSPIRSVEYVVIRRKIPSLPKKVKCKSCKGKGEKKEDVTCPVCFGGKKIQGEHPENMPVKCENCEGKGKYKEAVECGSCKEGLVWSTANLDTTIDTLTNYFNDLGEDISTPQIQELLYKNQDKDWSKFCNVIEHHLGDSDIQETMDELHRVSMEIKSSVLEYGKTGKMTVFPKNVQHCSGSYFGCQYKEICSLRLNAEDVDLNQSYFVECSDHPELDDR